MVEATGSNQTAKARSTATAFSFNASSNFLSAANVYVNTTTATGTASQPLQVNGGAYVSGNLGVGRTNPSTALDVNGTITCVDINSTSDINFKENIQTFTNALDIIQEIRGVRFEWKKDHKPSIGVVAQEIEKVLPELVTLSDPKTVNYNGMIGVMIEAIKEQQEQINIMKNQIECLENER
jgi:hypothetical protein